MIGENRKMLVFPLDELPELGRGQGVQLQRYRDGGLADAMAFPLAEGLSWALGGESGRMRTETDLTPWRAAAAQRAGLPPIGFPRTNRFEPVPTCQGGNAEIRRTNLDQPCRNAPLTCLV